MIELWLGAAGFIITCIVVVGIICLIGNISTD